MAILLSTILDRESEVFNLYIESNGRETALQPLVTKYSKEDLPDGQIYPFIKIFEYLKLYVSSELITPEELAKFNAVSEVNYEKKVQRGKEIVQLLIENGNRWKEVAILAKKYAQEDGRFRSYTSDELKEWRRIFLTENKDKNLERTYRTVVELSRNRKQTGYDITLLEKVLEYETIEEAKQFLRSISISQTSLKKLLEAYKTVFPNKLEEAKFIEDTINEVFKEEKTTQKFIPEQKTTSNKAMKIINFKNLLEEYLVSDLEKIDSLLAKHNYSKYGFEEMYKDMESSTDPIINMLMTQYEAKQTAIGEIRRKEIEQILIGLVSGITYGNGYYRMNYYDLKMITDMSLDDILKYANKFFTRREYEMVKTFVQNRLISRTYKDREELFNSVNYGKNGRMVTDEEKWMVIEYMEYNHWPYSTQLMLDTLSRYMDNIVTFQIPEETEENQNKMNK